MALIRAATAETCGQDIEVPDIMLYFTTRRSNDNFVGDDASLHAANMLSPGAVMSGCKMFGSMMLGPREVKGAMTGAGLVPISVSPGRRVAVGLVSARMYLRIEVNSYPKTTVVGYTKVSTVISLYGSPTMVAAPPALCTSCDADSPSLVRQTTIFPLTSLLERVPLLHRLHILLSVVPGISTLPA
nr:hypothetical protein CDL15_Pgr017166 [Ipomoea batatas]